jgi:glycosyltransferase involved in cell wall biosynthesis
MTYGIVISSFNYGHLAAHAIESVLSQTRKYDKIWFVDDGAGDCTHLEKLYPQVEFVFRESNLGIVENFNNMLSRVDTDYVMFLGADNWLRSDALAQLDFKLMPHDKVDILVYDIIVTGELKKEIRNIYHASMFDKDGDYHWTRNGGHHGSMLYRTELAKKVGGYANNRTSSRTDEDLNLWDKMRTAGATVRHINEALLYYRRHRENFNKY